MSEHDHRILTQAADDLKIAATDYPKALAALEDARRGLPGSGFGNGGGGHSSASPVEAALGLTLGSEDDDDKGPKYPHPDLAQARLDELAVLLPQIKYAAQRLRSLVVGNTPHAPTRKDQREVASANHVDTVCECCTKWRPKGRTELVHATGDVNGVLAPLTFGLCRWCYDFVRDIGRLPNRGDVERNNDGKRRTAKPLPSVVGSRS